MSDAITLENVSKKLGGRQILNGVNFSIQTGDIFGYLGPNGAGKTTTIRIILGLMTPTHGKVSVLGKDVSIDGNRRKVGFVLETDGLYDYMTAYENLIFYSDLYDVSQSSGKIQDILNLVRLGDRAKDKVSSYSKGMRQRLALARAMVHDPDILILDEPTAGVDPTGQIEVRQIILDMAARGKTIFFSSHNLDEVQRICNRIALINRGLIKLYGETEKLQRQMSNSEVIIETSAAIPDSMLNELHSVAGLNIQKAQEKTIILTTTEEMSVPDVVAILVHNGVRIEQVKRREASVEEIYTSILKEVEPR
jgi:ABC-2 type transport system ATP-binding protein